MSDSVLALGSSDHRIRLPELYAIPMYVYVISQERSWLFACIES